MSKKKTTEQKKFIAIDTSDDVVIGIGNNKIVKSAIEAYANDMDIDKDRVDEYIEIYELGSKKTTNVNWKLDVEFY